MVSYTNADFVKTHPIVVDVKQWPWWLGQGHQNDLCPAVTIKIRSRPAKPYQLLSMPEYYI